MESPLDAAFRHRVIYRIVSIRGNDPLPVGSKFWVNIDFENEVAAVFVTTSCGEYQIAPQHLNPVIEFKLDNVDRELLVHVPRSGGIVTRTIW